MYKRQLFSSEDRPTSLQEPLTTDVRSPDSTARRLRSAAFRSSANCLASRQPGFSYASYTLGAFCVNTYGALFMIVCCDVKGETNPQQRHHKHVPWLFMKNAPNVGGAWLRTGSSLTTKNAAFIYIGWQWRNFFISAVFRYFVGQALRNGCCSDVSRRHFFNKIAILYGHFLKPTDSILFE